MRNHEKAKHYLFISLLLLPCWALAQGSGAPDRFCQDAGPSVMQVDSSRSQADILVRKAGFLKRFGHDHIIQARQIEGYVYWPDDLQQACGVLAVEVASLAVDDPALREKYQMDTKPSKRDIAKTKENMLSKVLESDQWPTIKIVLAYAGGEAPNLQVNASLEMHGVKREMVIPMLISQQPRGLFVSGELAITQSDFGIVPFTAIGGGLKIEDKLQIIFTLFLN